MWGSSIFSLSPLKIDLSKMERKVERKWGTKSTSHFGQKCSPLKFKKCFSFCHFLQLVLVLFLLLLFIHFFFLLCYFLSFSLVSFLSFFWPSSFFFSFTFFLSFLFFFYFLICFGFLCSSLLFNKNIMCNFLLSNKSMRVNLYELYFISSYFLLIHTNELFILPVKHTWYTWGKTKSFLSSNFSIISSYFIIPLFHFPNQTKPLRYLGNQLPIASHKKSVKIVSNFKILTLSAYLETTYLIFCPFFLIFLMKVCYSIL